MISRNVSLQARSAARPTAASTSNGSISARVSVRKTSPGEELRRVCRLCRFSVDAQNAIHNYQALQCFMLENGSLFG